jgi:E3 ubiquitin-protein ligase UBR7
VIVLQYPKDEEGEPLYDELVCQACVPRCSFISQYPKSLIPPSSVIDDVAEDPVEAVEPVTSRG